MFRLLILLAAVALAAWGLMWLADNPGVVTLTWGGVEYKFSLMLALGAVAAIAVLWSIVWGLLRFVFRIPSLMSIAARARQAREGPRGGVARADRRRRGRRARRRPDTRPTRAACSIASR